MTDAKKDSLEDLFQTGIGILAAILTIYGFVSQSSFKILIIGAGIILLYIYTRTWIKDFIARDVLIQNEKIDKIDAKYQLLEKKVMYMKGWMNAINHFKNKKGRGAIDPLTLLLAIVILILIISFLGGYFYGRLP